MGRKQTTLAVAMAANAVLIGLKYGLASASGSVALAADAWHSVADLLVTAIVLLGLVLADQPRPARDARRIEHGGALLVAVFVFYMAYRVLADVGAGHEHELSNVFPVAVGALLTIAISYFMGRFKLYVGRQTSSPGLIADGYHSTMHMYSSLVVVAGLFGYLIGFRSLDRVAAVLVALFIGYTGYRILADAAAGLGLAGVHAHGAPPATWWPSRGLARLLGAGVVGVYLLSGLYYVQPGEQGVVRRFGQRVGAGVPPGLHYRLPWPVESATRVPVAEVRRYAAPPVELLTGDENLLVASVAVQYDVADAGDFLFNVAAPDRLLGAATGAALRGSVGDRGTDDLLTTGRPQLEARTAAQLQGILDAQRAGIRVRSVSLVSVAPPKEVADAFVDVASAREDKATFVNEALAYQNELLPKARGEAQKMLRDAEAYRAEKVNQSQGEAGRFRDKLAQYARARDVTTTRLYLEAIERVLPRVRKFVVSPELRGGSLDLWFLGEGTALPPAPTMGSAAGSPAPRPPAPPPAPTPSGGPPAPAPPPSPGAPVGTTANQPPTPTMVPGMRPGP